MEVGKTKNIFLVTFRWLPENKSIWSSRLVWSHVREFCALSRLQLHEQLKPNCNNRSLHWTAIYCNVAYQPQCNLQAYGFLNETIIVIFPEWICCNLKLIIKVMGQDHKSRWWEHCHTFWSSSRIFYHYNPSIHAMTLPAGSFHFSCVNGYKVMRRLELWMLGTELLVWKS